MKLAVMRLLRCTLWFGPYKRNSLGYDCFY